ncbi:MAG TPA: hypothetical protein VK174_08865, partial [Chitinophagales bacterium]|nr:hypothetical protein [Chitinophagales bacterium]
MKTNNRLMTHAAAFLLLLFVLTGVNSCKKNNDPNVLGGETNIPLTQKDSVTNLYFTVNGVSDR